MLDINQLGNFRAVQKLAMIRRRGGFDALTCDICEKQISPTMCDMHELISRSHSRPDTYLRMLCYHAEVCSILCVRCHPLVQGNQEYTDQLFRLNAKIWTKTRVEYVVEQINILLIGTQITLPWEKQNAIH